MLRNVMTRLELRPVYGLACAVAFYACAVGIETPLDPNGGGGSGGSEGATTTTGPPPVTVGSTSSTGGAGGGSVTPRGPGSRPQPPRGGGRGPPGAGAPRAEVPP